MFDCFATIDEKPRPKRLAEHLGGGGSRESPADEWQTKEPLAPEPSVSYDLR
jgi:hypothetical protein